MFVARLDDSSVRSMVDGLPDLGSILVLRFLGVDNSKSDLSSSIWTTALPHVFGVVLLSQRGWWPLKSPPSMTLLLFDNKDVKSFWLQLPLGGVERNYI